jgi:hypothetical protein
MKFIHCTTDKALSHQSIKGIVKEIYQCRAFGVKIQKSEVLIVMSSDPRDQSLEVPFKLPVSWRPTLGTLLCR